MDRNPESGCVPTNHAPATAQFLRSLRGLLLNLPAFPNTNGVEINQPSGCDEGATLGNHQPTHRNPESGCITEANQAPTTPLSTVLFVSSCYTRRGFTASSTATSALAT